MKKNHIHLFEDFSLHETEKEVTRDQPIGTIKYFYHATAKDNLGKIMNNGIKARGVVFLADSFQHAAMFLAIRGMVGNIVVFKIDASKLDKKKLSESYDHSYDFFKCRAYMYKGNIKLGAIDTDVIMSY